MSKTIVFQGDSITDFGRSRETDQPNAALGTGYVNLIAADLLYENPQADLRIFNRGISGNRIVDLYARWKVDALNLKPDLISILIGINDTWHEYSSGNGVEPERYEEVYRMLLAWTRRVLPETKLLLMEPFMLETGAADASWRPEVAARGRIVRKLAAEFGAEFLPLQQAFDEAAAQATNEHYLADGVHPAPAGHRLISRLWEEAARKLL